MVILQSVVLVVHIWDVIVAVYDDDAIVSNCNGGGGVYTAAAVAVYAILDAAVLCIVKLCQTAVTACSINCSIINTVTLPHHHHYRLLVRKGRLMAGAKVAEWLVKILKRLWTDTFLSSKTFINLPNFRVERKLRVQSGVVPSSGKFTKM